MDAVVVFSGGANLGAAQVGMLEALLARGVRPQAVIGSSVGALNAAFVAVDPSPERVARLAEGWTRLQSADVFGGSRVLGTARVLAGRRHLHHPTGLRRLVRAWFEPRDLADTAVPLHVSTTELAAGTVRWWRAGDPVAILTASAAIPVVFSPVELDGVLHVDGALIEPYGLGRALGLNDLPVFVLDVGATAREVEPATRSAVDMTVAAIRAGRLAAQRRIDESLVTDRVTIVRAELPNLAYHDFGHTAALIECGRRAGAVAPLPRVARPPAGAPNPAVSPQPGASDPTGRRGRSAPPARDLPV